MKLFTCRIFVGFRPAVPLVVRHNQFSDILSKKVIMTKELIMMQKLEPTTAYLKPRKLNVWAG